MATCNAQDRAGWYCVLILGHFPGTNHVHRWPRFWGPKP